MQLTSHQELAPWLGVFLFVSFSSGELKQYPESWRSWALFKHYRVESAQKQLPLRGELFRQGFDGECNFLEVFFGNDSAERGETLAICSRRYETHSLMWDFHCWNFSVRDGDHHTVFTVRGPELRYIFSSSGTFSIKALGGGGKVFRWGYANKSLKLSSRFKLHPFFDRRYYDGPCRKTKRSFLQ